MARRSKFTPEVRGAIVSYIRAGGSLAAACRDIDLRLKTAEGWLARGRRETEGAYSEFAAQVEEARAVAEAAGLSVEEFERQLVRQVRRGSVSGMRLWWQIFGPKTEESEPDAPADPFDALEPTPDELAPRRQRRRAG